MASDYLVHTCCPVCGEHDTVVVPLDGYLKWQRGVLIQEAMPDVSNDVREQLMTGICIPCWDKSFGEYELNEDGDDEVPWID